MPAEISYWHNMLFALKLLPSISMGRRIVQRTVRQTPSEVKKAVSLQLGYMLWKDEVCYRGRILPAEKQRVLPRLLECIPQIAGELTDARPLSDHLVYTRTEHKSRFSLPRITPYGLWLTFGLIIKPKKLADTVFELQQGYTQPKEVKNPAAEIERLLLDNTRLEKAVKTSKRVAEFMRQITQMIVRESPDEEFIHNLCAILYKVAGVERCIALFYDEEQDALIAKGSEGRPNPWASRTPDNTREIEAFTLEGDHSELVVPLSPAGQKALGKKFIRRALELFATGRPGATVARRILAGLPEVALAGRLIRPETAEAGEALFAEESIITRVFRTGETLVVNDTAHPEHPISRVLTRMWDSKTFIATPIKTFALVPDTEGRGYKMVKKVIGVFGLDHDQHPQRITDETRENIELLVEMASIGFTVRGYTRALQNALGKHVGEKIMREILQKTLTGRQVDLGPQLAPNCSVMFTDIVNFTGISEKLSPPELTEFLTDYRNWMDRLIFQSEGVLDKYVGDAHLAAWGTPVAKHADDAQRALTTAIEMQKAAGQFMAQTKWGVIFSERKLSPLRIRIGIDTGEVMAGVLASDYKHEYTVLGEPVNRANRFEGAAGTSGILISEETFHLLRPDFIGRYVADLEGEVKSILWAEGDNPEVLNHQKLSAERIFQRGITEIKIGGEIQRVATYQVAWDPRASKSLLTRVA